MAKVVEVVDPVSAPAEYTGFNRLEIREYDKTGARHLYGVNEVDGRPKSTHLRLGKLATAASGAEIVDNSSRDYLEELESLKSSLSTMQEQIQTLEEGLSKITEERDELLMKNTQLREELVAAKSGNDNFEDNRTIKEKISSFFRGESLYTAYRAHPVRERIVEYRDNRPKVALVAGALAVAAVLLLRNTGGSDGLSEEQAQTLITQNGDVIDNQQNLLSNQEDIIQNQETIIENQGDIENKEDTIIKNQAEIRGDIRESSNKSTQDHRELHGDIHPDMQPNVPSDQGVEGAQDNDSSKESEYSGVTGSTASLEVYGDTISKDVKTKLIELQGYAPSDIQLRKATQVVLDMNNLNWHAATHLPVGYSYEMPRNLLEIANR